jgi:hypothetical protein
VPLELPEDQTKISLNHLLSPSGDITSFKIDTSSEHSQYYPQAEFDHLLADIPLWNESDETSVIALPDGIAFDDDLELADCSTSGYLSPMGKKSRIRRQDDSLICPSSVYDASYRLQKAKKKSSLMMDGSMRYERTFALIRILTSGTTR